jgi:hypothetical protein
MAEKYPAQQFWERKLKQRGGTDVNPTIGTEFAGPKAPYVNFPTDTGPVGERYPESFTPFAENIGDSYGQVYGDIPEIKILADRDRRPLLQIGFMCPFVGTENAFPGYSK